MIPKTIHYFWLSPNPKPASVLRYIASWKKHCPDYEVREWNQQNIEINEYPLRIQEAWKSHAWEYVEDYIALDVVNRYGGIYLNVNTKLCKRLDKILEYRAFFGFEEGKWIAPYIGFGAECGTPIIRDLIETYFDYPRFDDKPSYGRIAASERNMRPFLKRGIQQNGQSQKLEENIWVAIPKEYIHPEMRKKGCLIYGRNIQSVLWKCASGLYWFVRKNGWQRFDKWKKRRTLQREFFKKLNNVSTIDETTAELNIEAYYKKEKPHFSQSVQIEAEYDLMIVVPVYRAEQYIDQCVQSVLNQKTKYSYVAVFVDDGSPDKCGEILDGYSKNDCIRVIHQENRGFSGARNRALENICGRYVMFLDSDDYIPNYAVDVLLDQAYQHDADIVEGCVAVLAENKVVEPDLHIKMQGRVSEKELTGYPVAKVIRGEKLKNLCFPTDIWFEDTMIKTLLYPQCKALFAVPDVVYFYRKNLSGISSTCKQHIRCIDTYWITKYYLEEKRERGHVFGEEEHRQFLLQCETNQRRLSEMPEILQESVFVLTCELRKKYFDCVDIPQGSNFSALDLAMKRMSFSAYKHVLSNWDCI